MPDLMVFLAGAIAGALLATIIAALARPFRDRLIRKDAVARSRAVVAGRVAEQLVPYLGGFPFNARDARFLGSPVDLVVFDGLDEGELRRVVFLEVKTGEATLTARERALRDAVRARRVEWMEWRPGVGGG